VWLLLIFNDHLRLRRKPIVNYETNPQGTGPLHDGIARSGRYLRPIVFQHHIRIVQGPISVLVARHLNTGA